MIFAKPAAIYLKLVAAAVVINFFVYPFYGPGDNPGDSSNTDVWLVLNWFMAAGLAVALFTTWQRRAADPHDRDARAMFVATVVFAIAFVPNWFSSTWAHGGNGTIWHIIDTVLPVLWWIEGHRLWKAT